MDAFYLFALTFSLLSVGAVLSTLQALSSRQQLSGQLLLLTLSLWSLGETLNHTNVSWTISPLWLLSVLLLGVSVFCFRLTQKRINTPTSLQVSLLTSALLVFFLSFPILTYPYQLTVIAFLGLANSICLMLFCERIYQIGKSLPGKRSLLHRGLGLLSLALFGVFCEMAIAGRLHPLHAQIIAVSSLLLYPWLYQSTSFLQSLPQHLSISRPLLFHTTLFTLMGVYLIGLSGAGLIASNFNINGTSLIVLFGAGIFPLLYVFSSQRWRRSLLVSINKHFFSAQFDYRKTWRELTYRLSPDLHGQAAVDIGLRTIQRLIHQPQGCYFRRNNTGLEWAGGLNMKLSADAQRDLGRFLTGLNHNGWIIDTKEFQEHPGRYDHIDTSLDLLCQHDIRWVVPVIISNETSAFWLISNSNTAKWTLNWETRDFLFALGQQYEVYLQGQERQREMKEHAQLAAFNQTSAFVIHDIKNIYAQMSMINKNAAQHKGNPEFIDDMLESTSSIEKRLKKTLSHLTNKQQQEKTPANSVNLPQLLHKLKQQEELPDFSMTLDVPEDMSITINGEQLMNVLKHLIDNAAYAIKKKNNGIIRIEASHSEKHATIVIKDNGIGMSQDFMQERLFRPFETTKGNAGMGLGMYEAKNFAEQAGGHLSVDSEAGVGTQIYLTLPRSGDA